MDKRILFKNIFNNKLNKKKISIKFILDTILDVITAVTKEKYFISNIEILLNKTNGIYKTYIVYDVIKNNIPNKKTFKNIPIKKAQLYNPNIKIGDKLKKQITSIDFKEIDIDLAKKIIEKNIQNKKNFYIIKEFKENSGKLFTGIVKKITKYHLVISLNNNLEGILKNKNLTSKHFFQIGDKIKVIFYNLIKKKHNVRIELTISFNKILIKLLKLEIPEINEGIVEIKDIVRDPGFKSKVSVKTNNPKINPISACVGIRGSRIKTISNKLCGEKIDIVYWDQDIIQYIINIFSPIKIKLIEFNDTQTKINITVKKDDLSKIIGKYGKNLNLAIKLIKWNLNILTYDEIDEEIKIKTNILQNFFIEKLNIDKISANILIQKDFSSIEEIAYIPINKILEIKELKKNTINTLRQNAIKSVYTDTRIYDLYKLKNIDINMIRKCLKNNIVTIKELSKNSITDLINILNINNNIAKKIIIEIKKK